MAHPDAVSAAGTAEFLERLAGLDVRLTLENGQLRCSAPVGVLVDELREELRSRREELRRALVARAGASTAPRDSLPVPQRYAPLSFAQQRLWFFQQLEPASSAYNISTELDLTGSLDVRALEQAIAQVIARHDALRTTFVTVDGEPVQVVRPAGMWCLPVHDLADLPPERRSAQAGEIRLRLAEKAFDLETDLPIRVELLRIGTDRFELLVTIHHIVADGMSVALFIREIGERYRAVSQGQNAAPRPLALQYGEYARRQRAWIGSPECSAALAWWKESLAGDLAPLDFATDFPRPPMQTYRGAGAHALLDAATLAQLRALSRQHGSTLYMTLLAAFKALLYRYTGTHDLIVGSPVANRDQAELQDMIGMFVNTVALRSDLSGNPGFTELLQRVRETCLGAFRHQDVPFGLLLEELRPPRDLSRTPLFQVLFNLLPVPVDRSLPVAGLAAQSPPIDHLLAALDSQSKYDLTLYAQEQSDGLLLMLVYNADLFAADRMTAFLGHYTRLIHAIAREPRARIGDIQLEEPRAGRPAVAHVLRQTPFTPVTPEFVEASIPQRFTEVASRFATRPAVLWGGSCWTYGELQVAARQIARAVDTATAGTATRVALLCDHGAPLVAAVLGVLEQGSAYVPLDPSFPPERLALMLADAQATVLVADPRHRALAERLAEGRIAVLGTDASAAAGPMTTAAPTADSLAYILYTSGSSGQPKGVMQNHRNVLHHVRTYVNSVQLTPEDRVLLVASYTFDAAVMDLFGALLTGATLCPVDVRNEGLHRVAESLHAGGITVYHSTPTVYRALGPLLRQEECAAVRCVVLGGEEVRPSDLALFQAVMPPGAVFVNGLGPTESTTALQYFHLATERLAGTTVPVGYPVADTEVLLLDESGAPTPVLGELAIRSPYVALGYWRRPDLTASAFLQGRADRRGARTYRTGDFGRRRPDGAIEFLGRKDAQVKLRGQRIELGEIEATTLRHPGVTQCAVVMRDPPGSEPMLSAFVVAGPGAEVTLESLRELYSRTLPAFMVPGAITVVPALPLTRTSKVDRRALASLEVDGMALQTEQLGPRDGVEEVIAAIWVDVLRYPRLGVHDDFFALGGNSLNATQVVARLRAVAGIDVPLRAIFTAPTVAGLAQAIRERWRPDAEGEAPLHAYPDAADAPLSFSQERMWYLQQLIPDGTAYNMAAGALLDGHLDHDALVAGLHDLMDRHASLRTTFVMVDGEPRQQVHPKGRLSLIERDLRYLPPDERLPAAREVAEGLATHPFDLERGPLWWVLLAQLDEEQHVLAVGLHHTVGDLWSFGVIGRELFKLYAARVRHADAGLARHTLQYTDFSRWQRESFDGHRLDQQLAYWKAQLAGVSPLDLAADRPRPPIQTSRGARCRVSLSSELAERLRHFSAREGVTPFMTLFAAFTALLYRYTGQHDVAVGVPIANRTRAEVEEMVGTFVNTLVHRNDLSGRPTFRELLARVRRTALDAFEHQDLPFERLVREIAPDRDASRAPLFQVLFNLANAPIRDLESPGLRWRPLDIDRRVAQFDLALGITLEREPGVAATYNSDLFDGATIVRLLSHYTTLLESAIREPDLFIGALELLPADERAAVLEVPNATAIEFPDAPLPSLVTAQAARTPKAVALEFGETTLTYSELEARANRLAHHLRGRGVRPGTHVGVCLSRTQELATALLGVLKAGGAYVPIDPALPPQRMHFMLNDCAAGLLISEEGLAAMLPSSDTPVLFVDRDAAQIARQPSAPLDDAPDPDAIAYVMYTSGSTGQPKGVQVTHRGLVNFLWSMRRVPGLGEDDVLLAVTTISFDIAGLELYLPWIVGGRVLMASRDVAADGRRLLELLVQRQPAVMQATPATWRALLDAGWAVGETPNLRALCGGEALPRDLAEAMLARTSEVWNLYGPTETTIWSTVHRVTSGTGAVPIGRPIANTQVYVLDADGRPAPVGVPGELYIGGAGVARGYLGRPELTTSRFLPDPFAAGASRMYRTGDRVRLRQDGTFEHLGRLDFQVKLRGYRIELGEIEAALAAAPAIAQCVVDVRDDRLIAWLVFAEHEELTTSEIRAFLRESLPDYMVPSLVLPLDRLPLTPNGKVDRKALPDPLRATRQPHARTAPSTSAEVIVAEVWCELLRLEQVGTGDNFFELGGHSLLSMRAVHEIQQRAGWRPDPRLLFFQSLGQIAAAMPEPPPRQ